MEAGHRPRKRGARSLVLPTPTPLGRSLARSWWIGLTLFPLGWLGWGALVYAGLRARRRAWVGFGIVYLALTAVGTAIAGSEAYKETSTQDVAVSVILFTWGATFVHALVIRGEFLRRVAVVDDPRLELAERRRLERDAALELAEEDPERARELGVGRPDIASAFHGNLVDLNHAPAALLADLPGFDGRLAERAVLIREEIDGFESVDDLALFLDIPAPELERLRERAVCLPL